MSTMLKTAAMTLLSKTLQTFLYKYLSDVDVEGVALPSLYNSDGHSGWGVRLCNVKLREGLQLMELPGKKLSKKKKKRRRKKHNKVAKKKQYTKQQQQQKTTSYTRPSHFYRSASQGCIRRVVPPMTQQQQQQDDDLSLDFRTLSHDEDDDDDDDDTIDSRPLTPEQNSKSFLSCFYNTRPTDYGSYSLRSLHRSSWHGASNPDPPPFVDSSSTDQTEKAGNKFFNNKIDAYDDDDEEEEEDDDEQSFAQDYSSKNHATFQNMKREQQKPKNDKENEDEFEEYEQPMKLVLGKDGRIGTLDIRLIGKDLHVLVEDAYLTVEAVPISDDDDDDDDNDDKSTASTANETTSKAASEDSKEAKTNTQNTPEPKTTGEKVFAKNFIARILSAIPHLFLRDIRVRLIVREDAPNNNSNNGTDTEPEIRPGDCMVEFGVEFLSVTSGEDILYHFRSEEESNSYVDEDEHKPMSSIPSFSSFDGNDQNEYLIRHIRTGRGPEGGIWLKVFSPNALAQMPQKKKHPDDLSPSAMEAHMWARYRWELDTNYHFFRCAGFDLRARIYLGVAKEVARSAWFADEADEYTLNTILYGVDYVAPGPQLPLPPISPDESPMHDNDASRKATHLHVLPDIYSTDRNGIQSCHVESCFHRFGRGLTPTPCNKYHLPSETCSECWVDRNGKSNQHDLDSALPMPGLVLQITIRDPLEINVERESLETLGLIQKLFVKPKINNPDNKEKEHGTNNNDNADEATATTTGSSLRSNPITSQLNSKDDSTSAESVASTTPFPYPIDSNLSDSFPEYMQPELVQVNGIHFTEIAIRVHIMKQTKGDCSLAFCYWEILASSVTVDQQSLDAEDKNFQDVRFDIGLMDINEYRGTEHKQLMEMGLPCPRRSRNNSTASGTSFVSEVLPGGAGDGPAWPCTASVLLDVPPPLETLEYRNRERHGLQLRFIATSIAEVGIDSDNKKSMVDVRFGVTNISIPFAVKDEITEVMEEATSSVFGPKPIQNGKNNDNANDCNSDKEQNVYKKSPTDNQKVKNDEQKSDNYDTKDDPEAKKDDVSSNSSPNRHDDPNNDNGVSQPSTAATNTAKAASTKTTTATTNINDKNNDINNAETHGDSSQPKSSMKYKVQIDSANINMPPMMKISMPLTILCGEQSSENGLSMETILNRMSVNYGSPPQKQKSVFGGISLDQFASLPESVRMRILLFIDDLGPFQDALELKREKNSFFQTRSVNKGILKMAKKQATMRQQQQQQLLQKSKQRLNKSMAASSTRSDISAGNRRKELLSEFMKLDNDELEEIWNNYQAEKFSHIRF